MTDPTKEQQVSEVAMQLQEYANHLYDDIVQLFSGHEAPPGPAYIASALMAKSLRRVLVKISPSVESGGVERIDALIEKLFEVNDYGSHLKIVATNHGMMTAVERPVAPATEEERTDEAIHQVWDHVADIGTEMNLMPIDMFKILAAVQAGLRLTACSSISPADLDRINQQALEAFPKDRVERFKAAQFAAAMQGDTEPAKA